MNHSLHCRYSTLLCDSLKCFLISLLCLTIYWFVTSLWWSHLNGFFKTLYVKGMCIYFFMFHYIVSFFFSPYEWKLMCFVHENAYGPCDKTVTLSFSSWCQKYVIWSFPSNSVNLYIICSNKYCNSIFLKTKALYMYTYFHSKISYWNHLFILIDLPHQMINN